MEMDKRVKDLVETSKEIEKVEAGGAGGAWDYEGLKEALKAMFPKNPGARRVRVDKVLKFHDGELGERYQAYYARKAIEKAASMLGWTIVKSATKTVKGTKYVDFEVKF